MSFAFIFLLLQLVSNLEAGSDILVTAPWNPSEFKEGKSTSSVSVSELPKGSLKVSEILEKSAGVFVSSLPNSDSLIFLRGFGAGQVQVLIDGVPLSPGASQRLEIPSNWISSVTVIRGPSGSYAGSGAMGGVVLISTRKELEKTRLGVSYGSLGSAGVRGETFQPIAGGRLGVLLNYEDIRGNYSVKSPYSAPVFGEGVASELEISNHHSRGYGAEVSFAPKEGLVSGASLRYQRDERGIPGLLGRSFKEVSETKDSFAFSLHSTMFPGALSGSESSLSFNYFDLYHSDPKGEVTGFAREIHTKNAETLLKLEPQFVIKEGLILPLRLEVRDSRFNHGESRYRDTVGVGAGLRWLVLNDQVQWGPNIGIWKATDLETKGQYGVGAEWYFAPEWTLKGNLATGFRYPTFTELYGTQGVSVGNPDLRTEKTFGGELGIGWKAKTIESSLTYFTYNSEDLIEYVMSSGFQFRPYNFSKSFTEGFEFSSRWEALSWMSASTALTYQRVLNKEERDFQDLFVPSRPRFYGTSAVTLKPLSSLRVVSELRLALQRYVNRSNTDVLKDRYEWNEAVIYQADPQTELTFEVKNLLNRNNLDIQGIPLPGVSYYANVTYTF